MNRKVANAQKTLARILLFTALIAIPFAPPLSANPNNNSVSEEIYLESVKADVRIKNRISRTVILITVLPAQKSSRLRFAIPSLAKIDSANIIRGKTTIEAEPIFLTESNTQHQNVRSVAIALSAPCNEKCTVQIVLIEAIESEGHSFRYSFPAELLPCSNVSNTDEHFWNYDGTIRLSINAVIESDRTIANLFTPGNSHTLNFIGSTNSTIQLSGNINPSRDYVICWTEERILNAKKTQISQRIPPEPSW